MAGGLNFVSFVLFTLFPRCFNIFSFLWSLVRGHSIVSWCPHQIWLEDVPRICLQVTDSKWLYTYWPMTRANTLAFFHRNLWSTWCMRASVCMLVPCGCVRFRRGDECVKARNFIVHSWCTGLPKLTHMHTHTLTYVLQVLCTCP